MLRIKWPTSVLCVVSMHQSLQRFGFGVLFVFVKGEGEYNV